MTDVLAACGAPGDRDTSTCRRGHAWTPENTGWDTRWRYCRACARDRQNDRWTATHDGHEVTLDGRGRRRCVTCAQPDHAAVERATAGDPPPRLHRADRAAAIRQLRGVLPAHLVAERIGCSERTVWRWWATAQAPVPEAA